jgi:hypothetical protein
MRHSIDRQFGRRLVSCLVASAALGIPSSAGAETLFDQIDETSPQSINSQDFDPANDAFDAMTADDFVVPAGETWQIDSALLRGNSTGDGAASSVDVSVFADAGGAPGAEVFTGTAAATEYPRMVLSFAGPTLPPGTYWFGASAVLAPGPSAPFDQWYWAENSEPAGAPAMYRNPGNGFGTGCVAFTLKSSCVFGDTGAHVAPGQSFSLSGTRTLTGPDPGCEAARAKLDKAKAKLKKAKEKLADADAGAAEERATKAVKKAKDKVRGAKADVKEKC